MQPSVVAWVVPLCQVLSTRTAHILTAERFRSPVRRQSDPTPHRFDPPASGMSWRETPRFATAIALGAAQGGFATAIALGAAQGGFVSVASPL